MKDTNTNRLWKAHGILVWNGETYALTVDSPLLVMDTAGWAMSIKTWYDETAKQARKDRDIQSAESFEETASDVQRWLDTKEGLTRVVWPLALRQNVKPQQVYKNNLNEYLGKLVDLAEPAGPGESPRFLFDADSPTPTIYGLKTLRAAVRHTGPEILGVTVTEAELDELITKVADKLFSNVGCVSEYDEEANIALA